MAVTAPVQMLVKCNQVINQLRFLITAVITSDSHRNRVRNPSISLYRKKLLKFVPQPTLRPDE
jgi:hypothetical protein